MVKIILKPCGILRIVTSYAPETNLLNGFSLTSSSVLLARNVDYPKLDNLTSFHAAQSHRYL
jgi:hypothetical protein